MSQAKREYGTTAGEIRARVQVSPLKTSRSFVSSARQETNQSVSVSHKRRGNLTSRYMLSPNKGRGHSKRLKDFRAAQVSPCAPKPLDCFTPEDMRHLKSDDITMAVSHNVPKVDLEKVIMRP